MAITNLNKLVGNVYWRRNSCLPVTIGNWSRKKFKIISQVLDPFQHGPSTENFIKSIVIVHYRHILSWEGGPPVCYQCVIAHLVITHNTWSTSQILPSNTPRNITRLLYKRIFLRLSTAIPDLTHFLLSVLTHFLTVYCFT